jgi:hypothetical protein
MRWCFGCGGAYSYTRVQKFRSSVVLFMPLRGAAARNRSSLFMPLRGAAARNRSSLFMPLRGAAARNRSDGFPAPSCGQALRPAPIMNLCGPPSLVDHASAASDYCCGMFSFFLVLLFNVCRWLFNADWSCLGCERLLLAAFPLTPAALPLSPWVRG